MLDDKTVRQGWRGDGRRGALPAAIIIGAESVVADIEQTHLRAFNQAFKEEGLDWTWDIETYRRLLAIVGSREKILHYWKRAEPHRIDITGCGIGDTVDSLHGRKIAYHEAMVRSGEVRLKYGVLEMLNEARAANVCVAVVTVASAASMSYLLRTAMGPDWRLTVQIVEMSAHADGYLEALAQLRLSAHDCVAIDDSDEGAQAANAAGISVVLMAPEWSVHKEGVTVRRVDRSSKTSLLATLQSWVHHKATHPHQAQRGEVDTRLPEDEAM